MIKGNVIPELIDAVEKLAAACWRQAERDLTRAADQCTETQVDVMAVDRARAMIDRAQWLSVLAESARAAAK